MIVHCAHCESEGRPALLREKAPFEDRSISHGICAEHQAAWLAEAKRALDKLCPTHYRPWSECGSCVPQRRV